MKARSLNETGVKAVNNEGEAAVVVLMGGLVLGFDYFRKFLVLFVWFMAGIVSYTPFSSATHAPHC